MADLKWGVDWPTGVAKQHALSSELLYAAVAMTTFQKYATPVPGFGKNMGENVTWQRIAQITEQTNGKLTEGVKVPEYVYAISTGSVTVSEYGAAVPFSSFARDLSAFDVKNAVQRTLRDNMALVMDTAAATAMKLAKIKYAITGIATNNIATNGTFGATSSANMNGFHAARIRDYLKDTLFAPFYDGDSYIGIFRTKGIRGMLDDPDVEKWYYHTDPSMKFDHEAIRFEQIRFIECNHSQALAEVGTGSALGSGLVFGADALAFAEAVPFGLHIGLPMDFGRSMAVAWLGTGEWGNWWDTGNAGQAKIVHIGSL